MGRLSRTCPTCGGTQPAEIRLHAPLAQALDGRTPARLDVTCRTCGHVYPPLPDAPTDLSPAALKAWAATRRATRAGALVTPGEV